MSIPYIIQADTVTVFVNNRPHTINATHMNYESIIQAIKSADWKAIQELVDIRATLVQYTYGKITIENNQVKWGDKVISNGMTRRILEMFKQGFTITPMIRFMEKVMDNPSTYAIDELYTFLENNNLPITPNGNFLAYKKIRANYTDCHTGKMDNSVGTVVSMPRASVDANRNNTCSSGLHACSLEYLKSFSGERTVIVEIDPRDFVSCPVDYKNSKIRVCKYKVISEIANTAESASEAFKTAVQKNASNAIQSVGDKPKKPLSMTANAIRKREKRAALRANSAKK